MNTQELRDALAIAAHTYGWSTDLGSPAERKEAWDEFTRLLQFVHSIEDKEEAGD